MAPNSQRSGAGQKRTSRGASNDARSTAAANRARTGNASSRRARREARRDASDDGSGDSGSEVDIAGVQAEIQRLRSEVEAAQQQAAELERLRGEVEAARQQEQAELQRLRAEIEAAKELSAQQQAEIERLKAENAGLLPKGLDDGDGGGDAYLGDDAAPSLPKSPVRPAASPLRGAATKSPVRPTASPPRRAADIPGPRAISAADALASVPLDASWMQAPMTHTRQAVRLYAAEYQPGGSAPPRRWGN